MDEDLLSPLMGRMIDRAKSAARQAAEEGGEADGIALLLADETVVAAGGCRGDLASATERALSETRTRGDQVIKAAAIATFGSEQTTALPDAASRQALESVDPGLPMIVKVHGRWVARLLSDLPAIVESP